MGLPKNLTRKQIKNKYENDKRYGADVDDFDNIFSLRNDRGLYFELKRIYEIFKILNKEKIFFDNKKMLDVGCNYGLYANIFSYLKRDTQDVYGIDFISKYIKTAKKINTGINYKQQDVLKELDFENNFFDFIFINYVFGCIPIKDVDLVIKNITKKLKKGGHLMVFDFNDKYTNVFSKLIRKIAYFLKYKKVISEKKINSMNSYCFSKKRIYKHFSKDYKIIEIKKFMPFFNRDLAKFMPFWFLELFEKIFYNSKILFLLEKK
jgi:ubiquinone/menaquinone biosynthesis C-methylase UbiE